MSYDGYKEFYKTWVDATNKLLTIWSPDSNSKESKEAAPNIWSDWFSETSSFFQRMTLPPFQMFQGISGPSIFDYKGFIELTKLSFELYQEWLSLYFDFSKITMNANAEIAAKFTTGAFKDPKENYNLWIDSLEKRMTGLLRDPKTAERFSKLFSKSLDLKSRSDSFSDKYYSNIGLPTKSEMKRVYKELYLLKKELRKQNREQVK